ncbi:heavy-metal-associated domain-containing protein [Rugamonas fusca]|nr:heavy-metal-associated domain-containing protein [Rugamonas fusca]
MLKSMMATVCLLAAVAAIAGQTAAYRLRVDGLSCPFCAYGIEKKLGHLKGVRRVEVDIVSGSVAVTMAEGVTLNEADVRQAVLDAGFKLRSLDAVRPAAIDTDGATLK